MKREISWEADTPPPSVIKVRGQDTPTLPLPPSATPLPETIFMLEKAQYNFGLMCHSRPEKTHVRPEGALTRPGLTLLGMDPISSKPNDKIFKNEINLWA